MATINQSYNGFAAQAREATEKLQRVVIANVELAPMLSPGRQMPTRSGLPESVGV